MQSDSPCGGGQSIAGGYSVSPRPVGCGHTEQLSVHSKNLRQMNFSVCVCVHAYAYACVCVCVCSLLQSKYLARRGVVVLGGWSNGSG